MAGLFACASPELPVEGGLTRITPAEMKQAPEIVAEPLLQMGGVEGLDQQVFHSIQDIAIDDAANIYVIDDFDACARVFSPDGRFLRKIGGRGPGPGECSFPVRASLISDTLLVYDQTAIQVFVNADFRRATRMSPQVQRVLDFQYASTGPLLALTSRFPGPGKRWPMTANQLDLATGQLRPPIATLEMPTMYRTAGGRYWSAPMGPVQRFVFGPNGELYSTRADSFRIELLSPQGRVLHTIVADLPRVRVTEEDVQELIKSRSEALRDISPRSRTIEDETSPRLKYRAAIGLMIAGDGGRLLVERLDLRGTAPHKDEREWVIVAPNEPVIGRLLLPIRFTPHVLRGCLVTGAQLTDLGVPLVVQYRLHGGTHRCS